MVNKEKLELLTGHITRLMKLTGEMNEREIYPVSFFSQAYDITNKIQEDLQQIEIAQIDLFESQMKEHQAQILSVVRHAEKKASAKIAEPAAVNSQESVEKATEPPVTPPPPPAEKEQKVEDSKPAAPPAETPEVVQPEVVQPEVVQKVENKPSLSTPSGQNAFSDIRKLITLNDRFRFCRELFANNSNAMDDTLAELNGQDTYETSLGYLKKHFKWNFDDSTVDNFMTILKNRYQKS